MGDTKIATSVFVSIRALRIAIRFYVRSPGVRGTSGPPRLGEAT
jgi:hypothetical protein